MWATQNNVIWTNFIKVKIDNTQKNRKCRLCKESDKAVDHVVANAVDEHKWRTRLDRIGWGRDLLGIVKETEIPTYYHMIYAQQDGDTEYFDIVAGVLQGDTLAPYLFIICLDYVLTTSIEKFRENGFELTKRRSKRYPAKTITDADYADDLALLVNTPNQAETLLHRLERAAAGIGLHVNALKTEYMCYNQTGNIATLEGASLKLVDKFTYLGSSVSSTEKDIDTRLTKAWTAIDRLSIIWKSDLTDKMKRSFLQAVVASILLYGCTTWTLTKWVGEKN